jgi:hypothetical protein
MQAYQPTIAELKCPKCIVPLVIPRYLATGNDLTYALSAILHFGLSCAE